MKSHFLFSGAFAVASLLIGHQVFSADPILEGGARMSTLIPSDTVGVNIHDMVHDVAHILKCTKHDNHAVSLPEEIGNMLLRMGLAVTRSDVGTSYYDLGASVVFQTTEQQLPLSYLKGESLQLVPHLSIKGLENKLLNTSDIHLNVVIQLWGASLEEDYDQFSIGDNLYRFLTKKELPSSTALRCRSLPTGIISSILIHKERKWNSTDHRYLTLPFDVHYLKVHPDSHQVDGSLHFYSLVHFDESDGLHSILTQHILHLPDPEARKTFWMQILNGLKKDLSIPLEQRENEGCIPSSFLETCFMAVDGIGNQDMARTNDKFRIALLPPYSAEGEIQWSLRMAKVAKDLGWEWIVCMPPRDGTWKDKRKEFIKMLNPHCAIHFNYAFSSEGPCLHGNGENFLIIPFGNWLYPDPLQSILMARFDGFLPCLKLKEHTELENCLERILNRKFHYITTYPTAYRTEFNDAPKTQLFACGGNWDERGDAAYFRVYNLLGDAGYFHVRSKPLGWQRNKSTGQWLKKGYEGTLPMDGISPIEIGKQYGISLLLHGKVFRQTEAMSGKTLEICASSNVIISDKHPWVIREFGDNIYYIDVDNIESDPEGVFRQIDGHVRHIQNHQEEAIRKAKECHRIFCEKFSLEGELKKIQNLYEEIMADRNGGQ